ncbi:hypothetical protein HYV10_00760 [Candidatus Dependentiae bacterium]|nr:hypothetical protein [Candidatus Dependentiae bacterium]
MKKILSVLVVMVGRVLAHDECQESLSAVSWKDSVVQYWNNLSYAHKMIAYGIFILALLMIIYRLVVCKAGSCGCGCGGRCQCHK